MHISSKDKSSKGWRYITNILIILNLIFVFILISGICYKSIDFNKHHEEFLKIKNDKPKIEYVVNNNSK